MMGLLLAAALTAQAEEMTVYETADFAQFRIENGQFINESQDLCRWQGYSCNHERCYVDSCDLLLEENVWIQSHLGPVHCSGMLTLFPRSGDFACRLEAPIDIPLSDSQTVTAYTGDRIDLLAGSVKIRFGQRRETVFGRMFPSEQLQITEGRNRVVLERAYSREFNGVMCHRAISFWPDGSFRSCMVNLVTMPATPTSGTIVPSYNQFCYEDASLESDKGLSHLEGDFTDCDFWISRF